MLQTQREMVDYGLTDSLVNWASRSNLTRTKFLSTASARYRITSRTTCPCWRRRRLWVKIRQSYTCCLSTVWRCVAGCLPRLSDPPVPEVKSVSETLLVSPANRSSVPCGRKGKVQRCSSASVVYTGLSRWWRFSRHRSTGGSRSLWVHSVCNDLAWQCISQKVSLWSDMCLDWHLYFMFWWDLGLNSRLCTCKAGAQPLESHLQPILLWLFLR
jgi:hypothetical protein